jgi:Skp family chaperone for outer membrane proteins
MIGKILLGFAFLALFIPLHGKQAPTTQPVQPAAAGSSAKVAWIDIDQVIMNCDEGKQELGALQDYAIQMTKQGELLSKDASELKTQMDIQGAKLTDEAREILEDQIETKNTQLQRFQQDARNQIEKRRNRIANRIIRKAQPVIEKLARQNGLNGVLYLTQVAWADPSTLITDQVVRAYNAAYPVAIIGPKK